VRRGLILAVLGALSVSHAFAQYGNPFVTHYLPNTYGGSAQVFSITQDRRGVLYFGLGSGLLEYDGTSFRPIKMPGNTIVRALAVDPSGRVYAGSVGDFGYLGPDKSGQMQFISLLQFVPKEERGFQDVYGARWTPDGLYIQAPERLILLTPEEAPTAEQAPRKWRTKVWRPQTRFGPPSFVAGTLYVPQAQIGLMRLKGNSFELAPGGEQFATSRGLHLIAFPGAPGSGAESRMLAAVRGRGLLLMDNKGVRPFESEATDLIQRLGVSGMITLKDGTLGLSIATGGFLNLDREGRIISYLDRASGGLPVDGGLTVFSDRDGLVWVGMQKGVCKVETPSPLTRLGEAAGLTGFINDMVRFRGTLYAGTMEGIFFLDSRKGKFHKVTGLPASLQAGTFSLLAVGDQLFAAVSASGIYRVQGDSVRLVMENPAGVASTYVLYRSKYDPSRIYAGHDSGLSAYHLSPGGQLAFEGRIANSPAIRSIAESGPGIVWLGLESSGVMRVELKGDSIRDAVTRHFGTADGLAGDGGASVHRALGKLLFAVRGGVHEFDERSGRFVPSPQFQVVDFGGNPEEYGIVEDSRGNVVINLGQETAILRKQPDGNFLVDKTSLRRIANLDVTKTYGDETGVIWFGEADGMVRYDPRVSPNSEADYPALIRRVTAGEKTLLYGGAGAGAIQAASPLRYSSNAVRFEYSISSYHDLSANQYQTRLEGFDHDWSAWTDETRRDYTNLPPGDFRFHVRGRNLFQHESSEAVYFFTVLPPWYRTWWAIGLYALILLAIGFAADRFQRRRVIQRERERSRIREAELRAEAAAAQAQALRSENDRKRNVELLSDIGKELTSSLDLDTIFYRLYEHVNQLMDASVFGVGLYDAEKQRIDIRLALEKGKRYAPYSRDARNKNQFPVWCIENRQPVFINDVQAEYSKYISEYKDQGKQLEDGTISQSPISLLYLPLVVKERVLGVITVQSFEKNAYTAYHLDLLENLAAYTSIALDNADAYRRLNTTLEDLQATLERLKSAQEQLVVQEKLASLGALTAGIAHEIKNPLNFVNNFAELSVELNEELCEELEKYRAAIGESGYESIHALLEDLEKNARKINEHGKRADSIVRSMLLHSRGQRGERQLTDINSMLDEYVNLSYHGMRAQDSRFNISIEKAFAQDLGKIEVVPQDLSRVFLNILNNACYAVNEKSKKNGTTAYSPTLRVSTVDLGDRIEVRIRDNGLGIPPEVRDQIFNPFFTTKPTGQGTGLGLSISHDIVVLEHGGQLEVETEAGQFTEFVVRLPRAWRPAV